MPIIRTAVPKHTTQEIKLNIVQGIHSALVEAIGMPEDELFNLVSSYESADFFYSRSFNGITRSDNFICIEITMRRGRSDAMKKALYAAISRNLNDKAGVSPKDVFIFIHENDYSDWSVGNGVFAMQIAQQRGID
ncbi:MULTISPECIES: tautomerase family protein [Marinomonas]|uniref:Tautomerase family protein n=1 Tax=Marinomonas arctica TaxID=383750 RepID=A0A7H1JAQ2_9GAMM|nr:MULTISPECIES: tautomerase family protein [Marinomonas]MCS7488515.1 4-oxalocrotonate tautomerase [Marinomonas sp. BSi20414]QNT07568.1 tautomerase family protein [Marinomonas arctica]GGN20910.1 tautomerase [Marinomonas arctica]